MAAPTLLEMVRRLRAEAGHALSPAQGTNQLETLKYLLARTQEELWVAFVWPELSGRADIAMAAGQYLYPFPSSPAVTFDMVRQAFATSSPGSDWNEIGYGIPEDVIKPGTFDNDSRADPVQAWDVSSATQFRVYPTPNASGNYVRFKIQSALQSFVSDSDLPTIDATTIVLFTAAELLARAKAEDATTKMQKAQRHLTKMLGNKISAKNKVATLGGGVPNQSLTRTNRNLLWQS